MGLEGQWEESEPPFVRRVSTIVFRTILRVFWGLDVKGLESVPRTGPIILAGNHDANMDGFVLAVAIAPVRWLRFVGKAEVFRWPIVGWWVRACGSIPLERGRPDVTALRTLEAVLKRGWGLALFPEGTRHKPGRARNKPKAGVGFLAGRSGAEVVPARLLGAARWPRPGRLEVRFGAAMRFSGDVSDHKQCEDFAQKVMDAVFLL